MRRFAVFGSPVRHSLSPRIHRFFAEQAGVEISYTKEEPANFEQDVLDFFAGDGCGLNITLPYKQQAWQLVKQSQGDSQEGSQGAAGRQSAERAQAANTLFMNTGSEGTNSMNTANNANICAANTDGDGLVRDIQQNLKWELKGRKLALLGAGGSAYGITGDLLQAGIESLLVVNRTQKRAEELVAHFNMPNLSCAGFEQLASVKDSYDLLINATSVSLQPNDLHLFKELIAPTMQVYDLFYDCSRLTPFLTLAEQVGVRDMADGLGMLVEQAALSFMIWNGDLTDRQPNTRQILQQLRASK